MRGEDAIRAAIAGAEEVTGDGKAGGKRDQQLAHRTLNDTGNSERFRARHGRDLIFVKEIGWLGWVGSHWSAADGDRLARLHAQRTAKKIFDEADAVTEEYPDLSKKLRGWAVTSGNGTRLDQMVRLSEPHLAKTIDQLDTNPYLLNLQNGTLELLPDPDKDARLRRHARIDLVTRVCPIGYDPEARAPRWQVFLDWALPEHDKQLFVQRLSGYCLVGDTREQAFIFFWGEGGNGKSTITETWQYILDAYAQVLPFAALVEDKWRNASSATPELADLAGARAGFSAESNPRDRLDPGRINALTGGEAMKVRHLNRELFKLRPAFKLIVTFNNKPVVQDTSDGIWRRMMLVHFTQSLSREEYDLTLGDKLKAEAPGILNHMLDGWRLWRERGLDPPEAVRAATKEYRDDSDPLGNFLRTATQRREGAWVPSKNLYACYEGWCAVSGLAHVMSQQLFGRLLTGRGIERVKQGTVFYRGIEIMPDLDFDWKVP